MENEKKTNRKKWTMKKVLIYLFGFLILNFSVVSAYVYYNFNKILTLAVYTGFNSNIISDVYELKFKKIRFHLLTGTIRVVDVVLQPREKPLKNYPYINSSISLKTKLILLKNFELMKLMRYKKLELSRIEIQNPEIELKTSGSKFEFFPYKDSTLSSNNPTSKKKLNSYFLTEFSLINASIHTENTYKGREFKLDSLNITFMDLSFKQEATGIHFSFNNGELGIARFEAKLKKDKVCNLNFSDFKVSLDSISIKKTLGTITYQYKNCTLDVKNFAIQTADSVFAIALKSVNLSSADQSLQINGFSVTPDIKKVSMLEKYEYQLPPIFTVDADNIKFTGLNFDTLVYGKKLFVEELSIDKVDAFIFKDKRKPIDYKRIAEYPGQKNKHLKFPVLVKNVKATNVNVNNHEIKPDGGSAKVKVNNINARISNYTNIDSINPLLLNGSGYIENKVYFDIELAFSYLLPKFTFNGNIKTFDLTQLNTLLKAYAPVNINKGIVDGITFSGIAEKSESNGTLTFLYHNLDIDLQLKERAKWQSDVLTFAANTYINNANPEKSGQPPRVVKFNAKRDINKGFLNIVLKSFFDGLKETIMMSKENKDSHKEEMQKWKKENKENK